MTKFISLTVLLLVSTAAVMAQTTGTITGTVQDLSGNVVAGATVTACPQGSLGIPCTPVIGSTTTNGQGQYALTVPVATYTVTFFRTGIVSQSTTVIVAPSTVTVANNVTYTGTVNLNGGGALNGSFSGPTTLTGNVTASLVCQVGNDLFLLPGCFSGTDILAQLQTAYNSYSAGNGGTTKSSGRVVHIPAGVYTASTAVTLTTLNKQITVACDMGSVIINWSATSGQMITLGWGNGASVGAVNAADNGGIKGCIFVGSGGTSIGLEMNDLTNGVRGAVIEDDTFQQFATNLDFASGSPGGHTAFMISFIHSSFLSATGDDIAMNTNSENIRFTNCNISNAGAWGVHLKSSFSADIYFVNPSFDTETNGWLIADAGSGGVVAVEGAHVENNSAANGMQMTMNGAIQMTLIGGQMLDDTTMNPALTQMISWNSGNLRIFGTYPVTLGQTVTQWINQTGGTVTMIDPVQGGNISALIGGTFLSYSLIQNGQNGGGSVPQFIAQAGNSFPFKILQSPSNSVTTFSNNAEQFSLSQPNVNKTGEVAINQAGDVVYGTYRVATDQTITAGASLTAIPGLSWTFPANTALNVQFSCDLLYSQATAAASDSFGVQDVTVAPTSAALYGRVDTAAAVFVAGNVPALAANTATTVVTFTPSNFATVFGAHLVGLIEQPSNASTSVFQIMAQFTTNNGTIRRGSSCQVF